MMNKVRSLQNLLRDNSVSADEFLQTEGIASQIRSNLSRFVDYCRTHRNFTIRMLQLAFNISYQELEDPKTRTASYTANQILGNQESEVVELFFQPSPSEVSDPTEIKEQIVEGIQSEAQRLFRFDDEQEQSLPPVQPRQIQIKGHQLVSYSLDILKNQQINQTCLGHLQKMFSFFIRNQPQSVLEYFQNNPSKLDLLLDNIKYSSVSTLLAQLLTSEDKKKEYKYEGLKKLILERVVEEVLQKMGDQCYFDGAMVFLDQILSSTKQSYYQYFEDFKRIANYLVSQAVMEKFYKQLFKLNENTLISCSRFLESLFQRIISEAEDNKYYHKEENQPSMNFQIQVFTNNVTSLVTLAHQINSFKSITKIHFFSFLDSLLNSPPLKEHPFPISDPSFIQLFKAFASQTSGGMCRSKLYTLISGILAKASEEEIKTFLENNPEIFDEYFTIVKGANYSNTKAYNKNEGSAFDVSLIGKLTRKQESLLSQVSKKMGKDLKRMCKKYDTKIASFQSNSSFVLEQQSDFGRYNKNSEKEKDTSNTLVGKNNISIPVLHLPQRFQNLENKDKEEKQKHNSRFSQEVVEEEEVISITNHLDKLQEPNGISLTAMLKQEISKYSDQQNTEKKWPQNLVIPKQQRWSKNSEEEIDSDSPRKEENSNKEPKEIKTDPKSVASNLIKQNQQKCKDVVKEGEYKIRFYARHLPIFC